jgi:hypothetical protein
MGEGWAMINVRSSYKPQMNADLRRYSIAEQVVVSLQGLTCRVKSTIKATN